MNILYIDDDIACQKIMYKYLGIIGGHKVEPAFSAQEGLKKAAECVPDLILLDIQLPDTNGLQVLEMLLKKPVTEHIPVIFVTGEDLRSEIIEWLKLKPNFLHLEKKPMQLSRLLAVINKF